MLTARIMKTSPHEGQLNPCHRVHIEFPIEHRPKLVEIFGEELYFEARVIAGKFVQLTPSKRSRARMSSAKEGVLQLSRSTPLVQGLDRLPDCGLDWAEDVKIDRKGVTITMPKERRKPRQMTRASERREAANTTAPANLCGEVDLDQPPQPVISMAPARSAEPVVIVPEVKGCKLVVYLPDGSVYDRPDLTLAQVLKALEQLDK
jgi:hypothetical protein